MKMKQILCLVCIISLWLSFISCGAKEETLSKMKFVSQKDSSCSLEMKTLLGYGDTFERRLADCQIYGAFPSTPTKILPTDTGMYILAVINTTSLITSEYQRECIEIIRLNSQNEYEWHKTLDVLPTESNGCNTSINDAIVDESENLYICGASNNLKSLQEDFSYKTEENGYVSCISKKGIVQWIKFNFDFGMRRIVKNNDELICFSKGTGFVVQVLDVRTGSFLPDREIKIEHSAGQFWTDAENFYTLDENDEYWDLCTYSYANGFLWKQEVPFPMNTKLYNEKISDFGEPQLMVFDSNEFQIFLGGTMERHVYPGDSEPYIAYFHPFLICLSKNGETEWVEITPPLKEALLVDIECDNEAVYMVGYTDTPFLSVNENSYQPTIAGKTDLFIQALSVDHSLLWNTYLGGTNQEPANFVKRPEWVPAFMKFQKHQDKLFLTTTTLSTDILGKNSCPTNFNPYMQTASFKDQYLYSILATISTNGEFQQCTYTSTDAKEEELKQMVVDPKKQIRSTLMGDWVHDLSIHNNNLYIISVSNDIHTLLTNPVQDTLMVAPRLPPYFYFLSKYAIK